MTTPRSRRTFGKLLAGLALASTALAFTSHSHSPISVSAATAMACTYQWLTCTKQQRLTTSVNTKQCKAIKKATKANYKVKKADKDRFLVAQVTAVNEVGSAVIYATSLKKIK